MGVAGGVFLRTNKQRNKETTIKRCCWNEIFLKMNHVMLRSHVFFSHFVFHLFFYCQIFCLGGFWVTHLQKGDDQQHQQAVRGCGICLGGALSSRCWSVTGWVHGPSGGWRLWFRNWIESREAPWWSNAGPTCRVDVLFMPEKPGKYPGDFLFLGKIKRGFWLGKGKRRESDMFFFFWGG